VIKARKNAGAWQFFVLSRLKIDFHFQQIANGALELSSGGVCCACHGDPGELVSLSLQKLLFLSVLDQCFFHEFSFAKSQGYVPQW
jgi:hypothetical protein